MILRKAFLSHTFDPGAPESQAELSHEIPYFQFPGLSSYGELAHAVYTRHGGVSESSFHSLNTSYRAGDSEEKVRMNLQIIKKTMGARSLEFMNQVHEKTIVVVRQNNSAVSEKPIKADALITALSKTGLMVKQADCQAVILFDPVKQVISNIHCGWRGNTLNLLGTAVRRMKAEFGCDPSDLRAAIGPSLGPCCAEFITYEEIFPETFRRFMVRKTYFDLWALSRWQLAESGVREEHIEVAGICTRCRTDLFYSYRGEGVTGRFATVVMLK